jgi:hypothetical protein
MLVIIISARSLFIKDLKVSKEATKLINISIKDRNINRLSLFNIDCKDS